MDDTLRSKILELLDQHRPMTIATNRPDRWPQATTVGCVNEGLTIYFLCSPQSQKAANLARDNRVSLTVDHDVNDPMAITGLSMAAQVQPVTDRTEVAKAMNLLGTRYAPNPEEIAVYRVASKGYFRARLFERVWAHRSRIALSQSGQRLVKTTVPYLNLLAPSTTCGLTTSAAVLRPGLRCRDNTNHPLDLGELLGRVTARIEARADLLFIRRRVVVLRLAPGAIVKHTNRNDTAARLLAWVAGDVDQNLRRLWCELARQPHHLVIGVRRPGDEHS